MFLNLLKKNPLKLRKFSPLKIIEFVRKNENFVRNLITWVG